MPSPAELRKSLEAHLGCFKTEGKLLAWDGALAETLRLIFHGDIQESPAAWHNFFTLWPTFAKNQVTDPAWPLFIHACWALVDRAAYGQGQMRNQPGAEMLLAGLRNHLLAGLLYNPDDERLPLLARQRLQKVSDWLKIQPLNEMQPTIAGYSVAIVGSYPRYVLEYLILKAKQSMGDKSFWIQIQLDKYEQHLKTADIDVLFHLMPKQTAMQATYLHIATHWPVLIKAHWGSKQVTVHQNQLAPGRESVMFDDKTNNIQITVHAERLRTWPKGNLYINLSFNPITYQIEKFVFPSWPYHLDQRYVVHTFFTQQIMTPTLWGIMQQGLMFGHIQGAQLSLLAHCFKNIQKALNDDWVLSPHDRRAVALLLNQQLGVIMSDGTRENLTHALSTYIVNKYFKNQMLHGGAWLQSFASAMARADSLRSPHNRLKITLSTPKIVLDNNAEPVMSEQIVPQENSVQVMAQIKIDEESAVMLIDMPVDLNPGIISDTQDDQNFMPLLTHVNKEESEEESLDYSSKLADSHSDSSEDLVAQTSPKQKNKVTAPSSSQSKSKQKNKQLIPSTMIERKKKTVAVSSTDENVASSSNAATEVQPFIPEDELEPVVWNPENETRLQWSARKLASHGYRPRSSAVALTALAGLSLPLPMMLLIITLVSTTGLAYLLQKGALASRDFHLKHLKKALKVLTRLKREFGIAARHKHTLDNKSEMLAQIATCLEDALVHAHHVAYYDSALDTPKTDYFSIKYLGTSVNFSGLQLIHNWVQRDYADEFAEGCFFIRALVTVKSDAMAQMTEKEIHSELTRWHKSEFYLEIALLCVQTDFNQKIKWLQQEEALSVSDKIACFTSIERTYKISPQNVLQIMNEEGNALSKEMIGQIQLVNKHFPLDEKMRQGYYQRVSVGDAALGLSASTFSWLSSAQQGSAAAFIAARYDLVAALKPHLSELLRHSFADLNPKMPWVKAAFRAIRTLIKVGIKLYGNKHTISSDHWQDLFKVDADLLFASPLTLEGLRCFIENLAKVADPYLIDTYINFIDKGNFFKALTTPLLSFLLWHSNYFSVFCELKNFARHMNTMCRTTLLDADKDYLYRQAEQLLLILQEGFNLPMEGLNIQLRNLVEGTIVPIYNFSVLLNFAHDCHQAPGDLEEKKVLLRERINHCQYSSAGLFLQDADLSLTSQQKRYT